MNTLFWRGSVELSQLHRSYHTIVRDSASIVNIAYDSLRQCVAYYATREGMHQLPLVLDPQTSEEEELEQRRIGFLKEHLHSVTFARFDTNVESIDVTLWADLIQSSSAEIGFSGFAAPDEVFRLLSTSSVRPIVDRDLDRLTEFVQRHMHIQPQYA
jgi:hypothetical protein